MDNKRKISDIATEIYSDWKNPYFGAVPYLEAMKSINTIGEDFYGDSAKSIVNYFLSNAFAWKGEVAKRIKKELKDMLN